MKNSKILLLFLFAAGLIKAQTPKTVKIGKQKWMAENLNTDRFRNGDLILNAKSDEEWQKAGENMQPAWCYYDNRAIQADPENGDKYGKLYNWYAVTDARGLCPTGWHIPSDDEWTMLENALGGEKEAGNKMKSKSGWAEAGNGTNSSGFSGLPGGFRGSLGAFYLVGENGLWWSSTEDAPEDARFRTLGYGLGGVGRYDGGDLGRGFSVRCLRD
jgi:uncharacterized protein (TIGR02145 family)